ncbi:flavin reductase family protein [Kitasatospora sp. NPDC048540]|uniref:flavin reductase family protein n=1 Tax=unclassified Kitasatospora TaxID=2633591 RepID=UPI00053A4019|nr:flavin reductase family protein [Kitasatospora sp. MBT63]
MTAVDDRPAARTAPPADLLRSTLRRHAAGVTVITVPGPAGFTATSFTSVSLEPALVSFYLSATASSAPAVRAAEAFTVHVLERGQEELATRFARSGTDRFAGTAWRPGEHGTPLLDGVAAWLTARPVLLQPVGDHLLVVGEVLAAGAQGGEPLLHHDGGFGGFTTERPALG